ncbi:MAG: hypothetical protein M3541_06755 [Acidobacteriota bacterium]|nr:hypothetical protein [Acidobacteriota bacterium]
MEKQKMKEARRADKPTAGSPRAADGIDPDIAHIKPGPQPLAEWQIDPEEEAEETVEDEKA